MYTAHVTHLRLAVVVLAALGTPALADTTPQTLPFTQDWTNTGLITTNDDWSGVPGIVGYLGQGLTATTAVDPQTVLGESATANDVDVIADQSDVTLNAGGVAEFQLTNPVVALQGSGTADAPYLLITVKTTGTAGVRVRYNIRDIDSTADNAVQAVALQYRVGTTGDFTNVAAAFVADATEATTATKVTPVDVMLPADVDNQPIVQIRIITSNAQGSDEWVGIDDISIASTSPTGVGTASPPSALRGATVTLSATVTPGVLPASTGLAVACDLTGIGGSATQALLDDGASGDGTAGDNVFAFVANVGNTVAAGSKTLPCTVSDAESRSTTFSIAFEVAAVCGDGVVEGNEGCDDGAMVAGDGCSATCAEEPGYSCSGAPSTCADIDECATSTDDCVAGATCSNIPVGSFSCTCPANYEGDGKTSGTGCTDIDECATQADDCVAEASCMNTGGSFSCVCAQGYDGDGKASGTGCADIDECGTMADTCDANATCSNTTGQYECTCKDGYTGDGMTCADVDECATGVDNCSPNAACTNSAGSFSCACKTGYTGDGVTCTATGGNNNNDDNDDGGGCCSSSTNPGGVSLLVLFVIAGLRRRQRR